MVCPPSAANAPVTVRPSIILETGIRSEDDLTHKLVDIIRVNQGKESKEAGTHFDSSGFSRPIAVSCDNIF
jgi:hypothetical protein